jgi:hypothetical protein
MSTSAMKTGVLVALVLVNIAFVLGWLWAVRRHRLSGRPGAGDIGIGVLTSFLDTLGIGSFAPTTALFKFRGRPADELIPGTLNVGLNAAGFIETLLFLTAVTVQPALLVCMVASAAGGAWLGAGVVSRMPRRSIQLFMGVALLIAALFFAMKNLGAFPAGGSAFALSGWRFVLAVGVSFVLGALMCIGIGNYAPLMILLALLGMHPLAAFPIMLSCDGMMETVARLVFFWTVLVFQLVVLWVTAVRLGGVFMCFFVVNIFL